MKHSPSPEIMDVRLFLTVEHACSYLPNRTARNLVADPMVVDNRLYTYLATLGFRRSGGYVYRPHCPGCDACQSLRIPVAQFQPNRSQRRIWHRNSGLSVHVRPPRFNPQHYRLFERYVKVRHPKGGMDDVTPDSYLSFIVSNWSDTVLYEFRLNKHLLAVAVTDRLENALSAVYTFFDPEESRRSLGSYAILWQIAEAERQGLDWVYLGYWIEACMKMVYKANFRPHQLFTAGRWLSIPP